MGSRFKCSAAVIPFRCSFLGALQNFLRSRVFPKLDAALRASTPDMSIDHQGYFLAVSFQWPPLSIFMISNVLYPCSAIEVA